MAKLRSLIKIEGTLDDLTFYKGKDGYLVRTKGGVSANRIKNDPAFARTRENGTEFGHCAKSGKLLRRAILNLVADAKDNRVTSRLGQTMSYVKNEDLTSVRGQRQVAVGLATPEGKAHLKNFDFNNNAQMSAVLLSDFTLDSVTGEVNIVDLTPNHDLGKPGGATHVSFNTGFLNLDFETGEKDLQISPTENLPINGTTTSVTLTPPAAPTGTGNQMYFLKVAFFQEVNNVQYPLNNGAFNALQLIEVL
ncbi:hypothetical protein [Winogradskyella bathintestinalis]|uniref:DUF4469 domain-containing protein n=1 Tax=Winogradskyella bathintestinalis TaxID=3035208 RepID=A0ABT7ZUN6_9FLAO|nr:hypothetical protein [Winogradskyella bathintestinalis]MDN3492443.1 hypothetical protein [Winogradskyella bathintestinalis]